MSLPARKVEKDRWIFSRARLPLDKENPGCMEQELSTLQTLRLTLRRSLHRYGFSRSRGLRLPEDEYRQLVEEVADEAVCLGRARIDLYDPERGPLSYWLFLLGRRILRKELDRLARFSRLAYGDRVGEDSVADYLGKSGEKELWQVLERDRLGTVLQSLPEAQRQVLALFYVVGLSLEETGAILNKTPEAVSSLLQRARKNARDRLENRPTPRRGRPPQRGQKEGERHALWE